MSEFDSKLNFFAYANTSRFEIIEAAFLWLGVEPTQDLLRDPPHDILAKASSIRCQQHQFENDELRRQLAEIKKELIDSNSANSKLNSAELTDKAIRQFIRKSDSGLAKLRELYKPVSPVHENYWDSLSPQEFLEREVSPMEVDRIKGRFFKDVSNDLGKGFVRVFITRTRIIQIANKWDEKPRFLFPTENQPLDPRQEESYLKLISGLLATNSINPADRNATGKIYKALQLQGYNLSQPTIRKILNSIREQRK